MNKKQNKDDHIAMIRKNRKSTGCLKYNPQAIMRICSNPKAEPFWVADMDFESPKVINDALMKAARHGLYGYPSGNGALEAAHGFIKEHHGIDFPIERIVPTVGVLKSLAILTEKLPGAFIVPMPAYKPFASLCELQHRKLSPWPMLYDRSSHRFSLDFELLEKLCRTGENSALIFCSPHNPTGRVFSEDELGKVVSICHRYNVRIICDEIHGDLVYPGKRHIPLPAISWKDGLDSISLMAPSKTFNMAGEHFSLVLFSNPDDAVSYRRRAGELFVDWPSYLDGLMAETAYREGRPWLEDCVSTLHENARFIHRFLTERLPRIHMVMPEASFVCFLDCSEIREPAAQDQLEHPRLYNIESSPDGSPLTRFFGVKCNVAVNAGTWFGAQYGDFVRFNFATDRKHIENALLRMEAGVKKLEAIRK